MRIRDKLVGDLPPDRVKEPAPERKELRDPDPFTDPHRTGRLNAFQASGPIHRALLGRPPESVDGVAFCAATLEDVRARVARGERCVVVFDIDNTLVDTRYRTLAIARAWGEEHGVESLARATLDQIGIDGRDTCHRLGLGDGAQTDSFQAHWLEAFWSPESFIRDQPLARTVELARAAHEAGAEVYYLTGRIEALRETSTAQLERCGLPVDGDHLVLKPDLTVRTASFKDKWLHGLIDSGAHLGFFVTEGRRDVHEVQSCHPELPCVLFAFPLDHHDTPVRADTPVLPM